MKIRLDNLMVKRDLVASRSQAENYIRLGKVFIREKKQTKNSENSSEINAKSTNFTKKNDENSWRKITKAGFFADENAEIKLAQDEQFVSRAALKLKSVAEKLKVNFCEKTVLDIGSSTGGFTEFALTRGAKKVIAVDVGTEQLHPKLRAGEFAKKIELHEKTDIRNFKTNEKIDVILADVSFISLREILPHVERNLANKSTQIVVMVKPQFETGFSNHFKNRGVIKNEKERREILREFELWTRKYFVIIDKKDSEVVGAKGNRERFYLLKAISVSGANSTK